VLHCHGTSSDCFSTDEIKPLVDAGFSVLTPSRPGYGRTPLSTGRTSAQAAEALVALLDCLQVQTCAVVAVSGGGPTGVALAGLYPQRVTRLVLLEAVTWAEERPNEPGYRSQAAFYGPLHNLFWGMLGFFSRVSPRSIARQNLFLFSTHDPDDALARLSAEDIPKFGHFFQGHSSRQGALNDLTHTVGPELLRSVSQPTLVVHSREDRSVPFSHAEWSLEHIPQAELCESGFTGHFFWIGPDFQGISRRMAEFLQVQG
jgi:pimeloyl-ACP methyl ester carboxylesterase